MRNTMLKKIGICLLLIPLGFFLLFAFGEIFSGDLFGLPHIIQNVSFLFKEEKITTNLRYNQNDLFIWKIL